MGRKPGVPGWKRNEPSEEMRDFNQGLSQVAAPRRLVLVLFIAAQFIGLARMFFISLLSPEFNEVAALCAYGSLFLLPILCLQYHSASLPGENLSQSGSGWVTMLSILSCLSAILGLINGYYVREVIQDFAPYVVLCAFVIIGSRAAFWDDLHWLMPSLLAAAIFVNALGFTGFGELIERDIGERVARELLSYRTQSTLAMLGIAFLLIRRQRAWYKIITVVALYFYIGQQILFQKRLGTGEILLYLGGFFVIMPLFARFRNQQDRVEDAKLFMILLMGALAAGICIAAFRGEIFFAQLESLFRRFVGLGVGQQKESVGLVAALVYENERLALAMQMFGDFNLKDWLIGRGMGGHFETNISLSTNDVVRQQQYVSSYLMDVGVFGRREIEIGWLMPFMKGGFVLLGMVLWGVKSALTQISNLRSDPISLAAWTWLLVESVYLLQGGGFIMSSSYRLILFGACMGRCLTTRVVR